MHTHFSSPINPYSALRPHTLAPHPHTIQWCTLQVADRAPLVRDRAEYERLYKWSIDDPQDFWGNMAQDYFWAKKVGG